MEVVKMMSNKGGTQLDKMAHTLMEFAPHDVVGATTRGVYTAFYHEDRLFFGEKCRNRYYKPCLCAESE